MVESVTGNLCVPRCMNLFWSSCKYSWFMILVWSFLILENLQCKNSVMNLFKIRPFFGLLLSPPTNLQNALSLMFSSVFRDRSLRRPSMYSWKSCRKLKEVIYNSVNSYRKTMKNKSYKNMLSIYFCKIYFSFFIQYLYEW